MLPEEIKQNRISLNLTQSELAERFGVDANTVARWERGEVLPKAEGMLRLAFQTLEIEKGLDNSQVEALRDVQSEKIKRLRVRHAKNKTDFLKAENNEK